MSRSPLKRLLICLCVLSLSVVAIAPRQAHASPGIWDWIQKGLKIAAIVRGTPDELSFDIASWTTSAATAAVADTGHKALVGCSFDDLMFCGSQQPPFPDPNTGSDEDRCDPCRPSDPGTATAFMGGGAFGYASAAIQGISEINPPFSLNLYAKDLTQDTLIGGQVQADISDIPDDLEGWAAGWAGAYYQDIFKEATYAFWKQMRNLAYLLFVLVLIAMGFMVMLRYQVSPRVTVTVTSALPRIALGLVLITFSYPIVSVAVDLIIPLTIAAKRLVIGAWYDIAVESTIFETFTPWVSPSGMTGQILATVATIFSNRINLFSVVFCLIILIALLFTLFLAFWTFLKHFIGLIKAGILGPIIIAWGTMPGNEDAITDWFKSIIANVLALPSIILVMNAGLIILMINPAASDAFPLPIAFVGDLTAQLITFIMGLSILWQAHKVPGKIDEAFSGGGNRR